MFIDCYASYINNYLKSRIVEGRVEDECSRQIRPRSTDIKKADCGRVEK